MDPKSKKKQTYQLTATDRSAIARAFATGLGFIKGLFLSGYTQDIKDRIVMSGDMPSWIYYYLDNTLSDIANTLSGYFIGRYLSARLIDAIMPKQTVKMTPEEYEKATASSITWNKTLDALLKVNLFPLTLYAVSPLAELGHKMFSPIYDIVFPREEQLKKFAKKEDSINKKPYELTWTESSPIARALAFGLGLTGSIPMTGAMTVGLDLLWDKYIYKTEADKYLRPLFKILRHRWMPPVYLLNNLWLNRYFAAKLLDAVTPKQTVMLTPEEYEKTIKNRITFSNTLRKIFNTSLVGTTLATIGKIIDVFLYGEEF